MAKILAGIGTILLIAGLLTGYIPVSYGVTCGSAFLESPEGSAATQACDGLRSVVRVPALVFLAIAVILLLAALIEFLRSPAGGERGPKEAPAKS
ncbi:hypothetical protein N5079_04440 [Planotetraspora sp. A-T 1434]|uniref:hypothetical protein n=1 Tax=Planotetraspora sp. A-T 1434 TaxID=2979219 RepID=UPI0021C1D99B|nr:hypothetical protein [Planotetraspora sp. A-T 1434]MCT9929464.1 hypothetical protein [Planotetraspora sp. A-T 1434]